MKIEVRCIACDFARPNRVVLDTESCRLIVLCPQGHRLCDLEVHPEGVSNAMSRLIDCDHKDQSTIKN